MTVWVISRGSQYEGGGVVGVRGTREAADQLFLGQCKDLRDHWSRIYEGVVKDHPNMRETHAEYLAEELTETNYLCACDFVDMREYEVVNERDPEKLSQ